MTDLDMIPVLLVDDRPENLIALEALLENRGLNIFKATSGNEALRLSLKHDFAIVLMDVQMPDMDGFETAELMRANQKTSRLPIIFVTAALKDTVHQFKGYEAGAFDYLLKPIEPAVLRSKIKVFSDLYQQRRAIELREQQLETLVNERTAELQKTLGDLRESDARYRELLASVTSYVYTVVVDSCRAVMTTHGSGCLAVTGFSTLEYAADPDLWYRMIHPEDRQAVLDAAQRVLTGKSATTFEHRILHKDGSPRWMQSTLVPHIGPEGQLLSYDGVILDITERKNAESALRKSESELHESQRLAHIGSWDWDALTDTIWWSEEYYRIYNLDPKQPTPKYNDHLKVYTPESCARLDRAVQQAMETGEAYELDLELACPTATTRWISARGEAKRNSSGKIYGLRGTAQNITERKRSEELIKNILECVDEGFLIIDRDFRILSANNAYAKMFSIPVEKIIGRHCYEVSHHVTVPCYQVGHPCAIQKVFETRKTQECAHMHQDGKGGSVHIETKAYPLLKDGAGEVVTAIETLVDVTEKHKLEDQLRQAQKMESIGTLAGGIAHDFNNILSAIIGYGNIALMKMAKDDPQRLNVEHMLDAGDRAAHLTKDLLLFSRKQTSERKPIDVNDIIRKVEKFLKRVIGEDVECRTTLKSDVLPILGDAHQLEQVMMNFATNARDAMPKGGIFSITTDQAKFDEAFISIHGYGKPGNYVLTTLSDTGKGMDKTTQEHIFEPFFTTKEVGRGTGLGLAVVYGIIKQHEGFINVYSEPGRGTTFKLYLPLIEAHVDEITAPSVERPTGGTETILLAEDDEMVRNLTRAVLQEFGYRVITAIDGQDAVKKYQQGRDTISLLLLDLIMPKMTGKEAYDEIKAIKPDIKVMFLSGYARDMISQKALLDDNAVVTQKPISPTLLLKKVREELDRG